MPPENMAIDMRRTNLKAEEAALLSGELKKPSWQSRNEGIHERVSFEDTIWGFDLAGGSYYKTPLRVTAVKENSRADKAGIRPGDKLKRINDIDTSTLTIQEAHQIILESGVHLKIAVTAPEDEEDSYCCYEDPTLENGYDSDEERRLLEEKMKKMQVHARVSHYWSLQWPWVSKRKIIYRESNCFMVPSKFEDKNRSKFPTQPMLKTTEDTILDSIKSERELKYKKNADTLPSTTITNGNDKSNGITDTNKPTVKPNGNDNKHNNNINNETDKTFNGLNNAHPKLNRNLSEVPETQELEDEVEVNSMQEDLTGEVSQVDEDSEFNHSQNDISVDENTNESELLKSYSEDVDNSISQQEISGDQMDNELTNNSQFNGDQIINEVQEVLEEPEINDLKDDELTDNSQLNEDQIISEVLEDDSLAKGEEESIIESILSDGEDQINHSDER